MIVNNHFNATSCILVHQDYSTYKFERKKLKLNDKQTILTVIFVSGIIMKIEEHFNKTYLKIVLGAGK